MASAHPILSDNEMRYFQFKAKQFCELMKEDEAWVKHCSEVSQEDCDKCPTQKRTTQNVKTVGIQVTPKKPLSSNKPPVAKSEKEASLDDLSARLELIELEMDKIYEASLRYKKMSEHDSCSVEKPLFLSNELKNNLEVIQARLRSSLAKIDSSLPRKLKKYIRPIKNVNSGYFLPHDLQKKRASSRKAYLASLENLSAKKGGIFDGSTKNGTITHKNLTQQTLPKAVPKTGKKSKTKPKTNYVEETLVKSTEDGEIKDQNIEYVVDGILDDLLREAVVDLNRTKLFGSIFQVLKTADQFDQSGEKRKIVPNPEVEKTAPKMTYNIDSAERIQLKTLLNPPAKLQPVIKKDSEGSISAPKVPASPEIIKQITEELIKTCTRILEPEASAHIKPAPKFTCCISHHISLESNKAKEITQQSEEFWKYLKRINRVVTGKFNPWAFCNAIADSIVDDCIDDVALELCNVPSALIKFLYNQEFLQQVE